MMEVLITSYPFFGVNPGTTLGHQGSGRFVGRCGWGQTAEELHLNPKAVLKHFEGIFFILFFFFHFLSSGPVVPSVPLVLVLWSL